MKAFLTTSFIVAALLGSALAVAQPPQGRWGHGPGDGEGRGHFREALNLTDAQKTAAKAIRDQLEVKADPLHQQARRQMQEIETLLDGAHPDATELGQKMIVAHATREQLKALHDEFETKFAALLDADQLAKFQQMQAMRKEFRGRMGGPPEGDEQ